MCIVFGGFWILKQVTWPNDLHITFIISILIAVTVFAHLLYCRVTILKSKNVFCQDMACIMDDATGVKEFEAIWPTNPNIFLIKAPDKVNSDYINHTWWLRESNDNGQTSSFPTHQIQLTTLSLQLRAWEMNLTFWPFNICCGIEKDLSLCWIKCQL